jgi:hypothetical protein
MFLRENSLDCCSLEPQMKETLQFISEDFFFKNLKIKFHKFNRTIMAALDLSRVTKGPYRYI